MTEAAIKKLTDLDEAHATARERVMNALTGAASEPQDVLLRWILENDINPHDVFTGWVASSFSTFEGMADVLHVINHALVDDGEISFVLCEGASPMIYFLDHREKNFRKEFLNSVQSLGHGDDVMHIFEPVGTVPDIPAYIAAFEAHEKARTQWFEENFGPE